MLCYRFVIRAAAFGGNNNVLADIVQSRADFFFAVGIHIGGIKIIDAVVIRFAQQFFCRFQ